MRLSKKLLVVALGALVTFSVLGCNKDTTTTSTSAADNVIMPEISNPDAVFYDGGTYQITYGQVYDEFKLNDGINRLLFLVDTELLADILPTVTQAEIDKKVKYLTYGTTDDDEINALTSEERANLEQTYDDNIYLLGYSENPDAYARLSVAKEKYATEQMISEDNSDETWYVGPSTIATTYESDYLPTLASIKIHFLTKTDAANVLEHFNLVSVSGELRLYTGTLPITSVPSTGFTSSNTQTLTDEEIISYFVQMYNYVYDYQQLPTDATISSLEANEQLQISYEDLYAAQPSLASLVFDTLGTYEDYLTDNSITYYTYKPVEYTYDTSDTSYYMVLNLNLPTSIDVSDFDGDEAELRALIGSDTYDEIYNQMIEDNLTTSGFTTARMTELRADHDFVIYDYYLGIDYQTIDSSYVLDTVGNETNVASYDSTYISADEFLSSSMNLSGALYALYAGQLAIAIDQYYAELYCDGDAETCDYDVDTNDSTRMEAHRTALEEMQTSFESSYYIYYYTFEEYVYLAYGAKTIDDMLTQYYIKSTLQPFLVYDELQADDWALLTDTLYGYIQDYYDNYFDLDVTHLLIYMDRNEDGSPDDYQEFYASLTDATAYDQLLSEFETAIRAYLAVDGNSYDTLVEEYNNADRETSTWAAYKDYGFYLMTESLGEVTYSTDKDTYETSFIDELIQVYQEYTLPANADADYYYDPNTVETTYGIHMIYVEPGTVFEKPSAAFTMTYDDENNPEYTVGIENTSDMLSIEQIKLYIEYRFDEIVYGDTDSDTEETYGFTAPVIPDSVMDALEAYFSTINDSLYVVGFLNTIVADDMQQGTFTNTDSSYCSLTDAELKAALAQIKTIYYNQVFTDFGSDN